LFIAIHYPTVDQNKTLPLAQTWFPVTTTTTTKTTTNKQQQLQQNNNNKAENTSFPVLRARGLKTTAAWETM
jgi:hypothetical protein